MLISSSGSSRRSYVTCSGRSICAGKKSRRNSVPKCKPGSIAAYTSPDAASSDRIHWSVTSTSAGSSVRTPRRSRIPIPTTSLTRAAALAFSLKYFTAYSRNAPLASWHRTFRGLQRVGVAVNGPASARATTTGKSRGRFIILPFEMEVQHREVEARADQPVQEEAGEEGAEAQGEDAHQKAAGKGGGDLLPGLAEVQDGEEDGLE
jgi:hypothetical protein